MSYHFANPRMEEGDVYYSLSHERVSGKGMHRPRALSMHAGRRRMSGLGAGCPGLRESPDVRGTSQMSGPKMGKLLVCFVLDAGFPGEGPDVRALARRRMSGAGAGCPAADVVGRLLVQLLGGCTGAGCPASGLDVRPL